MSPDSSSRIQGGGGGAVRMIMMHSHSSLSAPSHMSSGSLCATTPWKQFNDQNNQGRKSSWSADDAALWRRKSLSCVCFKRNGNNARVCINLTPLQEERLKRLRHRIKVHFDASRLEHQEALRALWCATYPGQELQSLVSDQWKEMGWQGKDPSTDFRGGGFISLENLLFFAKTYSSLLRKQAGKRAVWEYPFAVAGVNITFMITQMLDLDASEAMDFDMCCVWDEIFDKTFWVSAQEKFGFGYENEWAFDILYCVAFMIMDKLWLAKNATYMEFNPFVLMIDLSTFGRIIICTSDADQVKESAHSRLKKYLGDTMFSIDTSVEKIDKMLILEFGDIKASFEIVRIMRCHNFNDHLYENLLGCVSLEALHLISDELKKIDGQYLDNCSCSFKFIYGLPCKHRLLFFQSQFFSIPLDEIHCHWKRLSMTSDLPNETRSPDRMTTLKTQLEKMDPTMRYHMLDKMIDMVDPSNCKYQEPPYNTKNKGRPSKKEQSQPRMRSCFEPTNNRTRNPTKGVNDPYIKQMPSAYWIHVSHTIDVLGDGNCGYRAIAPQVGYNTEDGWKQVWADLYYEIEQNMDFYDQPDRKPTSTTFRFFVNKVLPII
ncbi:hypothetical protein OROGR_010055 [Orobanche gracilis]